MISDLETSLIESECFSNIRFVPS